MLLHALRVENFRAYTDEVTVLLPDLTALVGRNDVGKSSLFDAMAAFFEMGPIEPRDRCVYASEDAPVCITCVFRELPESLVLDDSVRTTLADEYLLNADGHLEIKKVYRGEKMKAEVFAVCEHPTADQARDLLLSKNAELKKKAAKISDSADKRSNVDLRRVIRKSVGDLRIARTKVNLAKEGAKEIWSALERHLPFFALFRADRPSTDEDAEIQDPMRIAVREAIRELDDELKKIQGRVEERAKEVAARTLEKLSALDETIASALKPRYRAQPKWDSVFKLAIDGENEIPINKRGSGVRRLILLSFFQAEVERKCQATPRRDVVYAVEEPETSQHPANQVLVVEALKELADAPGCQVLLSTHVPALAGMLPVSSIKHVVRDAHTKRAIEEGDGILKAIADDLGVLPDYQDPRTKVIVCVEGPTDVDFLRNVSPAVRELDSALPDLLNEPRVTILPMGGNTLKDWINRRYLRDLRLPEVHIYDSDVPEHVEACAEVNARPDESWAGVTRKREIENYYPESLVNERFNIHIQITNVCDVEAEIVKALGGKKLIQRRRIKRILAEDVAPRITATHLKEQGDEVELTEWFARINKHLV